MALIKRHLKEWVSLRLEPVEEEEKEKGRESLGTRLPGACKGWLGKELQDRVVVVKEKGCRWLVVVVRPRIIQWLDKRGNCDAHHQWKLLDSL